MNPVKKIQTKSTESNSYAEDKENILKDLEALSNIMQFHDQGILQLIIGLNALQRGLIEKNIITAEELTKIASEEAVKIKDAFMSKQEQNT